MSNNQNIHGIKFRWHRTSPTTMILLPASDAPHSISVLSTDKKIGAISTVWRSFIVRIYADKRFKECRRILNGQVFKDYHKAKAAIIAAFDEHYKGGK